MKIRQCFLKLQLKMPGMFFETHCRWSMSVPKLSKIEQPAADMTICLMCSIYLPGAELLMIYQVCDDGFRPFFGFLHSNPHYLEDVDQTKPSLETTVHSSRLSRLHNFALFRNESCCNANGVENRGYFALWPAVGHLRFDRKCVFKTPRYPGCHSTPACQIWKQSAKGKRKERGGKEWRKGKGKIKMQWAPDQLCSPNLWNLATPLLGYVIVVTQCR